MELFTLNFVRQMVDEGNKSLMIVNCASPYINTIR